MIRQPLILSMLVATTGLGFTGPPPGFEIIEVTRGLFGATSVPRLSECGQSTFSLGYIDDDNSEVFVWDNGSLNQITDNNYPDSLPDITDDGTMVWTIGYDGFWAGEIVMVRGGESNILGDGAVPKINNIGFVCWQLVYGEGCGDVDADIMYWDGVDLVAITDRDASNQSPAMNNFGDVVWPKKNICNNPRTADIFLYTDGHSRELPSEHVNPGMPTINDLGQVAWGSGEGLQLWDDGNVVLITDWGRNPFLNNLGDIFFLRWHDDTSTWQGWLYQSDGSFRQLTDDPFWNADGEMNDWGEIVWRTVDLRTNIWGIRFMRRIRTGDSEFDGDIDHDDLAKMVDCMTGPMWVERTNPGPEDSLCDCRFLDINHDGNVDLRDYAMFQENFGK